MSPELAWFAGAPRRRYADSEWDAYMNRWTAFTFPGAPGLLLTYCGDKCDVARSRIIGAAKGDLPLDDPGLGFSGNIFFKDPATPRTDENRKQSWLPGPPAVTMQFDDDVFPRSTGQEMLRLIHQDFEDGYDVVCAPTVNNETLTTMAWTADGKLSGDQCEPASYAAFGFVAFSQKFIRQVTPEGEELFWPGTPQEKRVPLYCHFGINKDDSMSFSELVRDQGFRLGVDARLNVSHRKAIELTPASAQWVLALRDMSNARRTDLYVKALDLIREGLTTSKEQTDAGTRE